MYFRKIDIASMNKLTRRLRIRQNTKKKQSEINIYISGIDRLRDLYNCRVMRVQYSLTILSRVFRAPRRRVYGRIDLYLWDDLKRHPQCLSSRYGEVLARIYVDTALLPTSLRGKLSIGRPR